MISTKKNLQTSNLWVLAPIQFFTSTKIKIKLGRPWYQVHISDFFLTIIILFQKRESEARRGGQTGQRGGGDLLRKVFSQCQVVFSENFGTQSFINMIFYLFDG